MPHTDNELKSQIEKVKQLRDEYERQKLNLRALSFELDEAIIEFRRMDGISAFIDIVNRYPYAEMYM